jgi:acyl carrier protein
MDENEIINSIRNYILDNFLFFEKEMNLDNDDSFLDINLIDSTGIIELVTFVEEQYHIAVKDNEITRENFDSINKIKNYIINKKQ